MTGTTLLLSIAALLLSSITLFVVLRSRLTVDLRPILSRLDALDRQGERTERTVREQLAQNRGEATSAAKNVREELVAQLELVRGVIEEHLTKLQEDNAQKLDAMRKTVDEQLQGTLEKRLGESFAQVSAQLEQVYRGLGEMQALATGVGDLKKVLSNVKSRGTWGEVQLGTLLEEVMSPSQYAQNVCTKGEGAERVEFAIRLPGRDINGADQCWLPIDSKFPLEDYTRLVDAAEAGDVDAVEAAGRQLELRTHACARDIFEKYI